MNKQYEAPQAGFVVFTAKERLATTQEIDLERNQDPLGQPTKPSEWVDEW